MLTHAAKSAQAAANYVTRRHRRPASIIRQQARRKTEPWPSQQAQITSDLGPQLKDADRPLAAQIGGSARGYQRVSKALAAHQSRLRHNRTVSRTAFYTSPSSGATSSFAA
jgi:hypothetical protein